MPGYSINTFEEHEGSSMLTLPCISARDRVVHVGRVQVMPAPRAYILYCHGNAEDVSLLRPFLAHLSRAFNAVVYAVEYTGYGPTRFAIAYVYAHYAT